MESKTKDKGTTVFAIIYITVTATDAIITVAITRLCSSSRILLYKLDNQ